MTNSANAREKMVATQIARRGIKNERVLAAMRIVPRERFVPEHAAMAYEDRPLPIAAGQTISQPYVVALMIEAAGVKPGSRVLNVGSGSGYAAAVMAEIGALVFAVERHKVLAEESGQRFQALGYRVAVRCGDGSKGWAEEAPFDAIVVDAAGAMVPSALKEQLAIGGKLVAPVGEHYQELIVLIRINETKYETRSLGGVQFVPLIED